MLYMVMHKMTDTLEAGLPPTPNVIQEMGKLVGEAQRQGIFVDGAGLKPTSTRVRVTCANGACTEQPTPRRGTQELIGGFVMLKVKDTHAAIAWTRRFAEAFGDAVVDVGPVTEAWDLGLMPKPSDAPLRVLLTIRADAAFESGAPVRPEVHQRVAAVLDAMRREGALLAHERLYPSQQGARLRRSGGRNTWTDGPFAETKELISGFSILRLDSLEHARAFTERYAAVLGDIEVDVRRVVER